MKVAICRTGGGARFSTIMNERNRDDRYGIDLTRANASRDNTERIYNRAEELARRGELLQQWADLLLLNAAGAQSLVGGRRRG